MSPEWLPLDGGRAVDPALLATRLAGLVGDGLTVSGGEPFLQAEALCILLDGLRRHLPGLSTMAYSGYRHEWLRDRGTEDQRELLRRLDILVDGPYVERRHAPLRWRGSTNQRIIWLSDRHRTLREESDTNAGLQVEVLSDGAFRFLGVPPTPGFRAGLVAGLARDGLRVETEPPA
jgi:anaerobic ribonucleoside-triphosphate reductase activating protein